MSELLPGEVVFHVGESEAEARALAERLSHEGLSARLEVDPARKTFRVLVPAAEVPKAVLTISHPELPSIDLPSERRASVAASAPAPPAAGAVSTTSHLAAPQGPGPSQALRELWRARGEPLSALAYGLLGLHVLGPFGAAGMPRTIPLLVSSLLCVIALLVAGRLTRPGASRPALRGQVLTLLAASLTIWATSLADGGSTGLFEMVRLATIWLALGGAASCLWGLAQSLRKSAGAQGSRRAALAGLSGAIFVLAVLPASKPTPATPPGDLAPSRPGPNDFPALNFRYATPDGFRSAVPKTLSPSALVASRSASGDVGFYVIAQPIPESLGAEQLADRCEQSLRLRADAYSRASRRAHQLAGLEGVLVEARVDIGARRLVEECFAAARAGIGYELVSIGELAKRTDVLELGARARSGFALIDKERTLPEAKNQPEGIKPFSSIDYGYRVELDSERWGEYPGLAKDIPAAEFGAQCGRSAGFALIPFSLPTVKQPLPSGPVHEALLLAFGLSPDELRGEPRSVAAPGGLTGREVRAEREMKDGRRYLYRARTLARTDAAFAIVEWREAADLSAARRCAGAIERVRFDPDPRPAPREPPRELAAADFFHDLGGSLLKAGAGSLSLDFLRLAVSLAPRSNDYLDSLVSALSQSGRTAEALHSIEMRLELTPDDQKLQNLLASTLATAGRITEAESVWDALFARDFVDDDAIQKFTNFLERQKKATKALELLERYRATHDSLEAAVQHSRLLNRQGSRQKAAALLEERSKQTDFEPLAAFWLADVYYDQGRHAEALELCDQILSRGFDWTAAYRLKADAQYELHWYAQAKSSLEAVLKRAPADSQAKQMLEHVSALIGEGANSAIKEPIEPVALPPELDFRSSPAASASGGKGAVYLRRIKAIDVTRGRGQRTTDYYSVFIESPSGVNDFSTFEFQLDPTTEAIFLNRLEVFDEMGNIVAQGKASDCYLSDQASAQMGTERRNLYVPVPGLKPRHRLDLVITRRDLVPTGEPDFLRHFWWSRYPALLDGVFVKGESAGLVAEPRGGVEVRQFDSGRAFLVKNPPTWLAEPLQPFFADFVPTLALGVAPRSWKDVGNDYLKDIGDRLAPRPQLESLAKRLAAGRTGRAALAPIARFVQKEITYKAIEFGRSRRVPHDPEETLKNRYGDCKDHALLLFHLLRAVGLAPCLTLVSSSEPVEPSIPTLDQFDHMVAYLPGEPALFLDATEKNTDLVRGEPYWLEGREALILEPGSSRLTSVLPNTSHLLSAFSSRRIAQVHPDGSASVREELSFTGVQAEMVRDQYALLDPARRERALQSSLAQLAADLELKSARFSELDEPSSPLGLQIEYRLARPFQMLEGRLVGRLPALWERLRAGVRYHEKRETPFRLSLPLSIDSQLTVVPPPGYSVALSAESVATSASPALGKPQERGPYRYELREAPASLPRGLALKLELTRQTLATRPASEFAAFREATEAALASLETEFVLVPSAGPASPGPRVSQPAAARDSP